MSGGESAGGGSGGGKARRGAGMPPEARNLSPGTMEGHCTMDHFHLLK